MNEFRIDKDCDQKLRNKIAAFRQETIKESFTMSVRRQRFLPEQGKDICRLEV